MRITKKYAGASCIGKQVFQLCDHYYECFQENERELQRLESLFLVRINGKGGGLSTKRGGSDAPPVPHQSIYETSNLDLSTSTSSSSAATLLPTAHLPSSATKRPYKVNRRGGSKATEGTESEHQLNLNLTLALGGSPQLVSHRHSHSNNTDLHAPHQAHYSHYDAYRSGSDYEDQSADDDYYENNRKNTSGPSGQQARDDEGQGQEQDDYEYAYDPDCDADSARSHAQQQQMLRQYHLAEEQLHSAAAGSPTTNHKNNNKTNNKYNNKSGFYNSFQAGGRRVLSAPNLTELNLSNWKDTTYRPLPADSLKEMFSLPYHTQHHNSIGGIASIEHEGHMTASLLPEHVYSAMGSESGAMRVPPQQKQSKQ